MLDPHFIIFGFVINVLGTLGYVVDTLKGETMPNRVSWLMWTIAPMVAFAAQISEGVGLSSLQTFAAGFCPLLVFMASFANRKSVWKLTSFDIICGVLSFAGLLLWFVTRHASIAILFAILADGLAAAPTIVKAWKAPESESSSAFIAGGLNALIALLILDDFNFNNAAFAIYIFIVCLILTLLISFKLGTRLSKHTV